MARWTRLDGRLLVLVVLGCYFGALGAVGPGTFWPRAGVPHLSPGFLDMHTITSGWECTRKGLAVLPVNPCDPLHRPVNYPRLWMAPAFLGIGQGATVPLGIAAVVLFLGSLLIVAGRVHAPEGLVYAAALCSPAVMLGIERGNVDLFVFTLLSAALLVFRRGPAGRAVGHGLFLLAAMLKLFPAYGWGPIARQRLRWALVGGTAVGLVFCVYVIATLGDIEEIRRVSPRSDAYSYGLGPFADLEPHGPVPRHVFELVVVVAAVAAAAALAWSRRRTGNLEDPGPADAFTVGAGVYCGSYVSFYNFDYRLIFLLLTFPYLLRSTRTRSGDVPLPAFGIALILGALWLGTSLPPLPSSLSFLERLWSPRLDELLNWLVLSYLGAGLLLLLRPRRGGADDMTSAALAARSPYEGAPL